MALRDQALRRSHTTRITERGIQIRMWGLEHGEANWGFVAYLDGSPEWLHLSKGEDYLGIHRG